MEFENIDPKSTSIKSNTIIKYDSNSSNRSQFSQLSFETNLKTPPDNWLCGRFGDHNWSYPLQKNNSSMLSSFRMANTFPECVGSVDVIADADNIKKLLLMPFDSSHISLMVHRIGNSLLIDEFDLANHLIKNEGKQWSWLKKFIDDMIVRDNSKSCIAKKPITRNDLQNRNMLCKFLHYSIDQNKCEDKSSNDENFSLSPKRSSKSDNDNNNSEDSKEFYFTHYNKESHMSEMVEQQLDRIEDNSGSHFSCKKPERNVLWTFEDIRMLVSSNMPIFGDSNHPAVSLRLLDQDRPINVLTGLDYWLDNLMCSVPEVVMCYHLDGIVQKYELIKTEDIPQFSSNNREHFSPKVIRNIAQNILSFLKSKATKSGHTYWLFKGKHDDVVKLYDLTTLCADYMEEDDTNPFTVPVAMLLYRVAKNMRDSNQSHSIAINCKIHKLLTNCLSLLDPKKHSQIISSANYLLSDVYVPNDIDPTLLPLNNNSDDAEDEDEDFEEFDGRNSPQSNESSDESNCPTLEVKKLSYPNYYVEKKYKKQTKPKQKNIFEQNRMDWNAKCDNALKHIIQGLESLFDSNDQKQEETLYQTSKPDESQKMANPSQAIPLHYSSLESNRCDDESKSGKEMTPKKQNETIPNWKTCLEVCLLQKGAQVYCILAELSNTKANCLKALKYIRMGIICYEIALILVEKSGQCNYLKEPIACLLALCGDIHVKILNNTKTDLFDETNSHSDTNSNNDFYYAELTELFEKLCESELKEEYRWAYNPVINSENSVEERLKLCYRCYEEALFQLKDTKQSNSLKIENTLLERLKKRLAYISNELAKYYMTQSLEHFNKTDSLNQSEVNKLDSLTKKSLLNFESAVELFRKVGDKENTSLMLSNIGRLMRTCAHIFAPHFRQNNPSNEFSSKEKHFYIKAIEYYNQALKELGVDGETHYTTAWDNINWELCTTLFTIGCLMQDFAPISTSAFEVIENEITKYFTQALSLCENAEKWDTSRHVLYQYRSSTICHRLGSLYHNSYRNMTEESERRKKVYNLSNDYYEKSRFMCKQLNNKEEFLRVTLEQIGLHEHNLTQLNGFSSKMKALHHIIRILLMITDIDFSDYETNDEKQEIENLLELFEVRMSFCVKGIIKCLSTKATKNRDLIKSWKIIDEFISKNTASKDVSAYKRVENLCNKLKSSNLLT